MSVLYSENQDLSISLDFFNSNEHLIDTDTSNDRTPHHESPILATPPPKRRRGRPPKATTEVSGQPSPAANLSAAVLRQGSPKTSSPLMRVSPMKAQNNVNSPSQVAKMVNPSPKGGLLVRLGNTDTSPSKKKVNAKTKQTISRTKKVSTKVSFYNMLPSPRISSSTQQNIQSLTGDSDLSRVPNSSSVNPSLLLSSPISSTISSSLTSITSSSKVRELQKIRTPTATKHKTASSKMDPPSNPVFTTASSPMTPLVSSNSSCFSSIIQSSPLYQGYYHSSPGTSILNSSPVKYQMKPIDIQQDLSGKKNNITELPRNPMNSPVLKPQTPEQLISSENVFHFKHEHEKVPQYKLSLSIDEYGQAKVTKTNTINISSSTTSVTTSKPKFTRHESLMSISTSKSQEFNKAPMPLRSNSTTHIGIMKSINHNNGDFHMFIEPSKMTNDPFFTDLSTLELTDSSHTPHHHQIIQQQNQQTQQLHYHVEPTSLQGLGLNDGKFLSSRDMNMLSGQLDDDDDVSSDARKALIKMLRRSV